MALEQSWLVAMWTKIYQQFCRPGASGVPDWLLSIPETGGLLPIDEYFLDAPIATSGPDLQRMQGNANFAYATNFIPHFAGQSSSYATVWEAYERVFGQADKRRAKFGLPSDLVGTTSGLQIEQQRQILLDALTAPDAKEYRETALSVPGSLFAPTTPWGRVSVRASEVDSTLAEAPSFLKRMFGWDGSGNGASPLDLVDEISFEFATATLVRNWLDLDQLLATLWDWVIPGTPALSDGASPPQGDLPAIPERVVFARNAVVTFKPVRSGISAQPDNLAGHLKFLPFMAATMRSPDAPPAATDSVLIKPWLLSAQTRAEIATLPSIKSAAVSTPASGQAEKASLEPLVLKGINLSQLAAASVSAQPVPAATPAPAAQSKPGGTAAVRRIAIRTPSAVEAAQLRIPTSSGGTPPVIPQGDPPPAPKPSEPAAPAPDGFGATQILAFLCRPLPRVPNPLPNIVYS